MENILAWWMAALVLVSGCGAPVLRGVPQANTATVAGVTAIIATGATLLDPDGQARRVAERDAATVVARPIKVAETVPADVLDRLDRARD